MRIGASDLDVCRMGLGGNVFGWTADETASHRVLDAYTDAGGNLIDTADVYSAWADGNVGGESETIIGSWLRGRGRRDDVVIATKVSAKPDRGGLAPGNVRTALEESLTRLGTDHVDLYYAHFDDPNTPLEESVAVFEELRSAGKTRYVALSNYTPERIEQWCGVATDMGAQAPVALQPHYNLLHRGDVEGPGNRGDVAARHDMGLIPYFSLAAGFLTGKYRQGDRGRLLALLHGGRLPAARVLRRGRGAGRDRGRPRHGAGRGRPDVAARPPRCGGAAGLGPHRGAARPDPDGAHPRTRTGGDRPAHRPVGSRLTYHPAARRRRLHAGSGLRRCDAPECRYGCGHR